MSLLVRRRIRRKRPHASNGVLHTTDYCNSILAGVLRYQLDRLQSNLNVAVRLIFGYSRYDHITPLPLLRDRLHWLWVAQRIDFKRCLMVFKALHGLASGYISDYCVRASTNQRWSSLRSVSHNFVWLCHLRQKPSSLENVRSEFAAPLRETLLDSVKDADSIDVFKSRLKIYLFGLSYGSPEFFKCVVNAPLFYELFVPTGYGAI